VEHVLQQHMEQADAVVPASVRHRPLYAPPLSRPPSRGDPEPVAPLTLARHLTVDSHHARRMGLSGAQLRRAAETMGHLEESGVRAGWWWWL
jgi:hypothetical protein